MLRIKDHLRDQLEICLLADTGERLGASLSPLGRHRRPCRALVRFVFHPGDPQVLGYFRAALLINYAHNAGKQPSPRPVCCIVFSLPSAYRVKDETGSQRNAPPHRPPMKSSPVVFLLSRRGVKGERNELAGDIRLSNESVLREQLNLNLDLAKGDYASGEWLHAELIRHQRAS